MRRASPMLSTRSRSSARGGSLRPFSGSDTSKSSLSAQRKAARKDAAEFRAEPTPHSLRVASSASLTSVLVKLAAGRSSNPPNRRSMLEKARTA